MTDYRPISRLAYCNEDRWRATVEVIDGSNRSQVQANIDLNPSDGTANPQMTLPNGTVVDLTSNTAFVAAFRALPPGPVQSREENQRICSLPLTAAVAPPTRQPDALGWGWLLLPATGLLLSYVPDRLYFDDLSAIPGFRDDPLRRNVFLVRTAGDVLRTGTYTVFQPAISDTAAIVSDSVYGAFGVAMAGVLIAGEGGDPELYALMNAGADIGTARLYRHAGQGYGSLGQLGVGALTLTLGLALPGGRPEVAERDIYVNLSPNPYRDSPRFPNLTTNLTVMGANHLALGLIHGIYYLVTRDPNPPPGPRVSIVPAGGDGGMAVISGTF